MTSLLDKIKDRDKIYFKTSEAILSPLIDKLNKAIQYLIKEVREINWVSIELVDGSQNFVYIDGIFKPKIGDIITYVDGTKSEITKDNIDDSHKNLIRIMVPINILLEGTPVEIYEKLKDYNQLNALLSKDELVELIRETKCEDLSDLLNDDNVLSRITRPSTIGGFSTKHMTDEQISQLYFYDKFLEIEETSIIAGFDKKYNH